MISNMILSEFCEFCNKDFTEKNGDKILQIIHIKRLHRLILERLVPCFLQINFFFFIRSLSQSAGLMLPKVKILSNF